MGKTTALAQFVRRFPSSAISVFLSSSNRLSFDIDMIRKDLSTQVYWILTGQALHSQQYNPLLLNSYYGDLQRRTKQSKSTVYFVIDGIDELDSESRERLLPELADALPIGIPQFRFLFSGDDSYYKSLLGKRLSIKSYPLTEFSAEEAKTILRGYDLAVDVLNDINGLCRGVPGRLASVRRALDRGIPPQGFVSDAPTKWPEFFEVDWRQVDQSNDQLLKVLSLLVHDRKPYSVTAVADILSIAAHDVRSALGTVNFLSVDHVTEIVHFANTGLSKYIAERLKDRKPFVDKLLIRRLLSAPQSDEAILELPLKLEEAAEYQDLVTLLTPDHLLQVLERTQTLSRVDDVVQRGFRSAKKLGRDADLLRFGLQQSIVAEIAVANTWESEIAALAALRRDKEALTLANSAVLREDRLLMLATLAHGIWLRADSAPTELLDSIRLLIDNLDYWSLGKRAGSIAAKLTCVSPDLATTLLTKAKWATDETSLDRAFLRVTVSALRDIKDDRRRDQAMEIAARSRQDPRAKNLLEGIRTLSGRVAPNDVLSRASQIENVDARLSLFRYWCTLNGSQEGADHVAQEAIRLALKTTTIRVDASLLADLSKATFGSPTNERRKELIAMLDGLRGTAERLGPSVDYVRLQLSLAIAEASTDSGATEGRLMEVFDYIARIGDVPSRGEAYALFLSALKQMPATAIFQSGDSLLHSCTAELEAVVLTLAETTADHYNSLGTIITGLAQGDVEKALEYTRLVNTDYRRNAVLLDIVDAFLHRPVAEIDPSKLERILDAITSTEERDKALLQIARRFADGKLADLNQLKLLLPVIGRLETITDSGIACKAYVCALQILIETSSQDYSSLRTHIAEKLFARWERIDVQWLRIDAGFGIARDLAALDPIKAEAFLKAADALKSSTGISAPKPASAFVACIRLVIRAICGLLPRRLETEADLTSIAALIDIIPAYGERAILWADLCIRATVLGRSDLADRLVRDFCLPAFAHIPREDAAYRAAVLIQIAPAVYRSQPATCLEALEKLSPEDRDLALMDIIRFTLFNRAPSDPVEQTGRYRVEVTHEQLLQAEKLARQLETDWMIYCTTEDIAELLNSSENKYSLNVPQCEDLARRFGEIAKTKLPIAKQITHPGFRIATLAQVRRFTPSKASDWTSLIDQAKALTNIADRVYVLQIIALSLR